MKSNNDNILEMININKDFNGVQVLYDVNFNLKRENILNLINNFINKIIKNNNNNDQKNIANNIFFDLNNKLHLKKFLKLSKVINCP